MPALWRWSVRAVVAVAFALTPLTAQAPAGTWTLRGRVVAEETGRPLAGCTVTITGHQATGHPLHWSWMDWENPTPLTTGADGCFELTFPAQPGRGIADGYPSRVHVVVRTDARVQQFGHVFLSRFFASAVQDVGDIRVVAGCSPDVIVVDTAGKPQEGVVVRLRHDDALVFAEQAPAEPRPWCWPRLFVEFRSDAAGRLVLDTPLAFGRHRIDVRNRKLVGDGVLAVARDATGPLRITVESATPAAVVELIGDGPVPVTVAVRIRPKLPTGYEAKRVAIHLFRVGATNGSGAVRVVAPCVDGIATVEGVPRGEYTLRIHAIGTGLWPSEWVTCSVRDGEAPVEVPLAALVEQPVLVFTTDGRPCTGAVLELALAYVDPANNAPVWEPSYQYPMTGDQPSWGNVARIAAPARTDRSGRATLRAIACTGPVAVRVRGAFVVPTDVEWSAYAGGTKPVEIRVPGAGVVVLEPGEAALRVRRDAAAPEDRARAGEWGTGSDPWGRSLGDLMQKTATGLLLRPTGEGGVEHFAPLADVAQLRFDSVAPGMYDVLLFVRHRKDGEIVADVVGPPLLQVKVQAGEVTTAAVKLQDAHREVLSAH